MSKQDQHRDARDLGSRSPASEEAKQQNASGQRGGPRGEGQRSESDRQPAQASGRRGAQHEDPARERKGFDAGQAPSEQGEQGHPSPHVVAQNQQGIGAQGGATGATGDRSEEEARSGEPHGEHTRPSSHGRERIPGG